MTPTARRTPHRKATRRPVVKNRRRTGPPQHQRIYFSQAAAHHQLAKRELYGLRTRHLLWSPWARSTVCIEEIASLEAQPCSYNTTSKQPNNSYTKEHPCAWISNNINNRMRRANCKVGSRPSIRRHTSQSVIAEVQGIRSGKRCWFERNGIQGKQPMDFEFY